MLNAGELIKYCRKFRGMSQLKLEEQSGVYAANICRYELGQIEPKFSTLQYCLEAMGFELVLKEKKR